MFPNVVGERRGGGSSLENPKGSEQRVENLGFVARSLGSQEQRGCPSPLMKGFFTYGSNIDLNGRVENKGAHRRRKNWVKKRHDYNHALGEDIG